MVNCPLCNSGDESLVLITKDNDPRNIISKELFELVKCRNCGLVYVSNMPKKGDMAKYYGRGYYAKNNSCNILMNIAAMSSRISKIPKKRSRTILDYGCGNGDFLLGMKKKGWDISGVEFSDDGQKLSSKKLGISIINEKDFYKLNKKFDVITLWHVLEHIAEPDKLLSKAKDLLKQDGTLVISVPNINSMQFNIFGKNTFHLDIPRHLVQYSPRTMKILLRKNGLHLTGINHYSLEYNPFGFVQSFLNSIGCEFNFLYNVIKRGYKKRVGTPKFVYNVLATFILLPFLAVISIPFTYVESFLGYGASFVIYSKK